METVILNITCNCCFEIVLSCPFQKHFVKFTTNSWNRPLYFLMLSNLFPQSSVVLFCVFCSDRSNICNNVCLVFRVRSYPERTYFQAPFQVQVLVHSWSCQRQSNQVLFKLVHLDQEVMIFLLFHHSREHCSICSNTLQNALMCSRRYDHLCFELYSVRDIYELLKNLTWTAGMTNVIIQAPFLVDPCLRYIAVSTVCW